MSDDSDEEDFGSSSVTFHYMVMDKDKGSVNYEELFEAASFLTETTLDLGSINSTVIPEARIELPLEDLGVKEHAPGMSTHVGAIGIINPEGQADVWVFDPKRYHETSFGVVLAGRLKPGLDPEKVAEWMRTLMQLMFTSA